MGHKPVGVNSSFAISSGSNARGVNKTLQQSDSLRVVAKGAGCHVAIGTLPTAAATNYYVHAGESEVISLGTVQSNRVVGVSTTGTNTIIDFAEGTGSDASSALNLINSGQPNLRTIFPYSYDQRHQLTGTVDFRYGEGKDYNGPVMGGKQILKNTGLNMVVNGP